MRNMSKKTWKLRVWNHMTEMQKLDILLKHAKVLHTYGRRWPYRVVAFLNEVIDIFVLAITEDFL